MVGSINESYPLWTASALWSAAARRRFSARWLLDCGGLTPLFSTAAFGLRRLDAAFQHGGLTSGLLAGQLIVFFNRSLLANSKAASSRRSPNET